MSIPMRLPDGARCAGCGYALRGLEVHRCPECGRAFDPTDLDSFRQPGDVSRSIRRVIRRGVAFVRQEPVQWTLLALVATSPVALMQIRGLRFWDNLFWTGLLSFILGWALWVAILCKVFQVIARPRRSAARGIRAAVVCGLLLIIPLSWTIGFDRCPHAMWIYVGPHITFFCVGGDPCSNPRTSRTIWDHIFDLDGVANWR